jgi:protein transport protein SEC23
MLGLTGGVRPAHHPGQHQPSMAANRFLLPVKDCEFVLTSILESLQRDPWPVANDKRPIRCTGVASSVAVGLLETTFPNTGARIMLFSGGAATDGPGQVVSNELREALRTHHNIEKETAKWYKRATKVNIFLVNIYSL